MIAIFHKELFHKGGICYQFALNGFQFAYFCLFKSFPNFCFSWLRALLFLPIFAAKKTRKIFAFFCLKVCLFLPSKSVLKKSLNSLPAKARIALKLQNRCRQRQGLPGALIFVARFAGKEAKAGKVSLLLLLPFFAFAMPNPGPKSPDQL